MANKSGVSDQVLSLPSGGGALEGTGGKFATKKQTGAGSFSLPIDVPEGRDGLQPELNLTYSTGNGDGRFGIGWALGTPAISRKTKAGVPVYDDEDTFLLTGEEDLVPLDRETTADGTTVTSYEPRTQGEFSRIEHHRNDDTDHWTVASPGGTVRRYGTPGNAGADPAVVADPADRSRRFQWQITETVDPFGNRIEYKYSRDSDEAGGHHWDQLYLDRVRYVDYEDDAGETAFLVSVDFEYEARPEPVSRHRAGFEIRTRKRCSRIAVRTHVDEDRPIRSYELTYRDEQREGGSANGTSQLASVQVVGHDDGDTQRLPPVEFDYATVDLAARSFETLEGPLPRRSLSTTGLELADLSGNGLPDIVEIDETIRYWRNLGDGEFDEPQPMDESPAGLTLARSGVQMLDANGDGRIDLATFDAPLSGYFPLEADGGWAEESFQPYDRIPSVDFDAPNVQLVDLDGDGVTDLLRSGRSLEYFFQDQEAGWTETRTVFGSLDGLAQVDFGDPRMRLADLSGDGLQDIVLLDDGHVSYWPNQGHGDWGRRVRMRDPPDLPRNYDPGRVLLGDVDGDGLADVVYVEDDRVLLWLNRCGNGWSDRHVIEGTPSVTHDDAIRLVDVRGNGIGGVLYSGGGQLGSEEMYFLDFVGEEKPYLMTETRNNMGATTRIEYDTSTEFYLQAEREGEEWKTSLPQPTWVVSRVESVDEISKGKLTREFAYHHGYWDGVEREFRGFGLVEQRDTETIADYNSEGLHDDRAFETVTDTERFSPPTLTKTWFHVGPVGAGGSDWRELDYGDEYWDGDDQRFDRPATTRDLLDGLPRRAERDAIRSLRGRELRTEVYGVDGSDREDRPYSVTDHEFGIREESPPDDARAGRRRVFFPHRVWSRETAWERGDDPQMTITALGDYDDYGQPRRRVELAPPQEDWSPGDQTDEYLATLEETSYATRDDETLYVVDRVAEAIEYELLLAQERTVEELLNAVAEDRASRKLIGLTRHYYDGNPFEGLPLHTLGSHGARVRTEELALTDDLVGDAYPLASDPPDDTGQPPYLPDEPPWDRESSWTDGYPEAFRNELPGRAGYEFSGDLPDGASADGGYFAATFQAAYDVQDYHLESDRTDVDADRGLLVATRDPLDNETTVSEYDPYLLNPTVVTNPQELETTAEYDYAAMQTRQVTDPNDNRTRNTYTPLGLVESVAKLGSVPEEGDTAEQPSKRFVYGLRSFEESHPEDPEPAWVHTIERERHPWDVVERENERRSDRNRPKLTDEQIDQLFPRDSTADVPERPEIERHPDRFVQSREYSDGFGRIVQSQAQTAERVFGDDETFGDDVVSPDQSDAATDPVAVHDVPADQTRVRVSGWKAYDNKGNVVERYEPFFLVRNGWEFFSREEAARSRSDTVGRHTETFYDALGRETRTVRPDGSESRIVRGTVPSGRLDDPDAVEPNPWEVFEYDPNDNAGRTHPTTASEYEHHWNKPKSKEFDALGRTVATVERNSEAGQTAVETHRVERAYDVRGNLVSLTDPLERTVFTYSYDLLDNEIRSTGIDAGTERVVLDAAGNVVERRDGKGALTLRRYDASNRLTHEWARNGTGGEITLRRRRFYAEADPILPASAARDMNLRGRVHRNYDEAGRVKFLAHDFKGNPLRKERRVLDDDAVRAEAVDWHAEGGGPADRESDLLAAGRFRTEMAYDALDRVTRTKYPTDVDGDRKVLRRTYDRGGAIQGIELVPDGGDGDPETYVADVGYDAAGNRTFVAYGNGVMTRYAYDDETKRLRRQLSQPYDGGPGSGYAPDVSATTTTLQDFGYEYDRVGNVRMFRDRTPNSGVQDEMGGADALDRAFEYDALNRLTKATGREASNVPTDPPWTDTAPTTDGHRYGLPDVTRQNAPQQTTHYTEWYEYDAAGNMTEMRHSGGSTWTRSFGVGKSPPSAWGTSGWSRKPDSNRVTDVNDRSGLSQPTHKYDAVGNLERERNSTFTWDHADRLVDYDETAQNGTPSVSASYAYDANGERVKKVVDKTDRTDVTVYIDGVFEFRRRSFESGGRDPRSNNTLHVKADDRRVALARVGDPLDPSDSTPAVRYHHGDHLDSSTLVVDDAGNWVNYEEFSPFGETTFGGYARKRYRFTGKERDEESGLYYHGARYYAPWLARWTTSDPAGRVDGPNLYAYVGNNPVSAVDPSGTQGQDPPDQSAGSGGASQGQKTLADTAEQFNHAASADDPFTLLRRLSKMKAMPAVPRKYGGFTFSQMGQIAGAGGGVEGQLNEAFRIQHTGPLEQVKNHVRPGPGNQAGPVAYGWITLEGTLSDPSSFELKARATGEFRSGSIGAGLSLSPGSPATFEVGAKASPPSSVVSEVRGTMTFETTGETTLEGQADLGPSTLTVSAESDQRTGEIANELTFDLGPGSYRKRIEGGTMFEEMKLQLDLPFEGSDLSTSREVPLDDLEQGQGPSSGSEGGQREMNDQETPPKQQAD